MTFCLVYPFSLGLSYARLLEFSSSKWHGDGGGGGGGDGDTGQRA